MPRRLKETFRFRLYNQDRSRGAVQNTSEERSIHGDNETVGLHLPTSRCDMLQ